MLGQYAAVFLVAYGGVVAATNTTTLPHANDTLPVLSPLDIASTSVWTALGNSTQIPSNATVAPFNVSAYSLTPQEGYTVWANGTVGPAPPINGTANSTSSALPLGTAPAQRRWTHPEAAFHGYGSAKF